MQRAASAITAVHTTSTRFDMHAMLDWHASQLKMPRPDAYAKDCATTLGGPGEFGYFGWPTIRSRPFSVMGQVARLLWPVRPNQS